jgi:A/G-specific adenine glycosylase
VRKSAVKMLPTRKLVLFREQLLAWFRQFQRDLPWRRTRDPYGVWLSEIMLQQTRVAAVIPYYERFLARFPDVRALAEASQEEVLRLWSGLGYYSRARNLQKAAQEIVAKHGGKFPRDMHDALTLPGIGNYTAAAILSIAYGTKRAVLDGNVARVLARLGAIRGDLRETNRWRNLQKSANHLLDLKSPGEWNQAMMELGATLCTPRAPQCLLCPVAQSCRARRLGLTDRLPEKRKKRATEEVTLAAAVFLDPRGHTFLLPPSNVKTRHPAQNEIAPLVSKMWHFPTVRVREHATGELQRFLAELFPAISKNDFRLEPLSKARHAVTYRKITLLPFLVTVAVLPAASGAKVVALTDVSSHSSLAVSNLTRKIARAALASNAAAATAAAG